MQIDYAAQVEAMRSGRLHVAGISTGPTVFGVNLAGYVPIAIMGKEESDKVAVRESDDGGPIQDFLSQQARKHGAWVGSAARPWA